MLENIQDEPLNESKNLVVFVAVKSVHPVESHALAWLHFSVGNKQHGIFGEEKCFPWEKQGAKVWGPCLKKPKVINLEAKSSKSFKKNTHQQEMSATSICKDGRFQMMFHHQKRKPPSLSLSLEIIGWFVFSFRENYAMALRVFRDGSLLLETPVEESLTASQDGWSHVGCWKHGIFRVFRKRGPGSTPFKKDGSAAHLVSTRNPETNIPPEKLESESLRSHFFLKIATLALWGGKFWKGKVWMYPTAMSVRIIRWLFVCLYKESLVKIHHLFVGTWIPLHVFESFQAT